MRRVILVDGSWMRDSEVVVAGTKAQTLECREPAQETMAAEWEAIGGVGGGQTYLGVVGHVDRCLGGVVEGWARCRGCVDGCERKSRPRTGIEFEQERRLLRAGGVILFVEARDWPIATAWRPGRRLTSSNLLDREKRAGWPYIDTRCRYKLQVAVYTTSFISCVIPTNAVIFDASPHAARACGWSDFLARLALSPPRVRLVEAFLLCLGDHLRLGPTHFPVDQHLVLDLPHFRLLRSLAQMRASRLPHEYLMAQT